MNTYETQEIDRAIRACSGERVPTEVRPQSRHGGRWDYIVRVVCIGCGTTLGRYELYHELAFCFNCRKFLFPDTVYTFESAERRFHAHRSNGHGR